MTETLAPARPLHAAFRSDAGRVRTNNEDLPLVDAAQGVFGVIDGVGGSAAGEVAAAIARDVILQRLSRPLGTPGERVREAIAIANNEIFARSARATELRGMSCVVTLAIVSGDVLTIGHVGDTRLYAIGPSGLRKLTHDHSPVGEREDAAEISELDAMRHPRRHEVFREVGGAPHDKDDEDFIEVLEAPWGDDQALLLCTDGLTDMVPSAAIDRMVRGAAGDPQRVVDALVQAANEAGGTDNVTVVYAEGPAFAAGARDARETGASHASTGEQTDRRAREHASAARRLSTTAANAARWIVRSRTTWFATGAAVGVAAALALMWRVGEPAPPGNRILLAGTSASGAYMAAAEALASAQPGDVVQLEPGAYAERIVVPDGVDLVARVPGSVTLQRPPDATGSWTAITAAGTHGGRLAGIRIESVPDRPIDVGIHVSGHGRVVELCEVTGVAAAAVDVGAASNVVLRGNVFEVPAAAVRVGDDATAVLTGNVLSRTGRGRGAPVVLAGSALVTLSRNAVVGFGTALAEGGAAPSQVELRDNLVLGAAPGGAR